MACFVDFEDFLDPGDDFVGGWIRRLVQVDHTILLQDVNGSICRRVPARQRGKVRRLDIQLVEVLETEDTDKS